MAKEKKRSGAWLSNFIGAFLLVALAALPAPAVNEGETDLDVRFENELIVLINAQRTKNGLRPLRLQSQLKAAARSHSTDMACNGFTSHAGSNGSSTRARVVAQGYLFSAVGENIAIGCDTPREVIAVWMNSPGHRRNVLAPSFTEIGTGYRCDPKNKSRGCWTAVFGNPSVRK